MRRKSVWFGMLPFLWLAFISYAHADIVYLRAEAVPAGGDAYEITIYQGEGLRGPATLALFLTFDAAGAIPVPATAPATALAQPAAAHRERGYVVQTAFHDTANTPGERACLALAVYSENKGATLSAGALLSFAVRLTPAAKAWDNLRLDAATDAAPVLLDGIPFSSSASAPDATPLAPRMEPLVIPVNCVPPNPPARVGASWRYRDRIEVVWNTPDDAASLEYRVYRGATVIVEQAVPLHDGWINDTVYVDRLGDELALSSGGCACSQTRFFYWVRARDAATGCESGFNAIPAQGTIARWWFPNFSCRSRE